MREVIQNLLAEFDLTMGLFLAGMFCAVCSTGQAGKDAQFATAVSGKMVGENSSAVLGKMETMAKSDHVALLQFCLDHYRDKRTR